MQPYVCKINSSFFMSSTKENTNKNPTQNTKYTEVILAEKDHRMYYFTTLKNQNPQTEANKF